MANRASLLRWTADADKGTERAAAAKLAVRAAKSSLKEARKALKTAKKAAKQARRKLETAGATAARAPRKVSRGRPAKSTPRVAGKQRVRKTAAKPNGVAASGAIATDQAEASQAAVASTQL